MILPTKNGFTLIELLIILALITIFSLIAIPSYQKYIKRSHEDGLKQDMINLSGQLEKWRSRSLTYAGFVPDAGYDEEDKSIVYVPIRKQKKDNSQSAHSKNDVQIQLQTMIGGRAYNFKEANIAINWVMIGSIRDVNIHDSLDRKNVMNNFIMTSNGIKCMSHERLTHEQVWAMGHCGNQGQSW